MMSLFSEAKREVEVESRSRDQVRVSTFKADSQACNPIGVKDARGHGTHTNRLQGVYSQHFIFFLTYKWAQALHYTKLKRLLPSYKTL
jgi:hypothetical protein